MSHAYQGKPNKSSQFTGVAWAKRDKKWESYITINGKRKSLGYHDTEELANQAYQAALFAHKLKQ